MKLRPGISLLCLTAALALSGCAEKWGKPGGTPQQFDAMQSACYSRASARFPPMVRGMPLNNGHVTPLRTSCTHNGMTDTCYQSGGEYIPPDTLAVDDNQQARDQDMRACYYENGWQPLKD